MKNLFAILLLLSTFNLFAQTKFEFYYAGQHRASQLLEFEGYVTKYKDKIPYEEWIRVSAQVELNFDSDSAQTGIGTYFVLSVENGKLSVNELSGKNIITLGTVDKFERVEDDGDVNIALKMKVQFKDEKSQNIFAPVQKAITSISEDDRYLNIITGQIIDPSFFKLILKVSKKKFLSSETLLNRRITAQEMDISPYGDHQSLITIDLEYLFDYLEPGDKYRVEVETRMDMGNTNILSKKYAGFKNFTQYKKETLKL